MCPGCDWPRQHSDVTPPPGVSMPDPNAVVVQPGQSAPVMIPHVADIQLTGPVVIPGQAPAQLGAIVDLGNVFEQPAPAAILRTLQLPPDDPLPEEPAE